MREKSLEFATGNMILMRRCIVFPQESIEKFSEMDSRLDQNEVRQILTIITCQNLLIVEVSLWNTSGANLNQAYKL